MKNSFTFIIIIFLFISTENVHAKKYTGKGPCTNGQECNNGMCIEINGDSYCSKQCGKCPAGMYCDDKLFSMMSMNVCVKGSISHPTKPKKPARLPCSNDNQCPGALICAQKMGQKDCTLKCSNNNQCEMPEMMGIKFDFMECSLDEGKRGRKACLPKNECISNPMNCMKTDVNKMGNAMGNMMGNMMNMANTMNKQADIMDKQAEQIDKQQAEQNSQNNTYSEKTNFNQKHSYNSKNEYEKPSLTSSISENKFNSLLKQIKSAGFDDERQTIIKSASLRNHFNCSQLGRILDILPFDDERIEAARLIAPKIVDRENSHTVLSHLKFDDEKKKIADILDSY